MSQDVLVICIMIMDMDMAFTVNANPDPMDILGILFMEFMVKMPLVIMDFLEEQIMAFMAIVLQAMQAISREKGTSVIMLVLEQHRQDIH